jgi:hypothetical protein
VPASAGADCLVAVEQTDFFWPPEDRE